MPVTSQPLVGSAASRAMRCAFIALGLELVGDGSGERARARRRLLARTGALEDREGTAARGAGARPVRIAPVRFEILNVDRLLGDRGAWTVLRRGRRRRRERRSWFRKHGARASRQTSCGYLKICARENQITLPGSRRRTGAFVRYSLWPALRPSERRPDSMSDPRADRRPGPWSRPARASRPSRLDVVHGRSELLDARERRRPELPAEPRRRGDAAQRGRRLLVEDLPGPGPGSARRRGLPEQPVAPDRRRARAPGPRPAEPVDRQPLPAAAGGLGGHRVRPDGDADHGQPLGRQPPLLGHLGDRRLGQDPPGHRVGPGART